MNPLKTLDSNILSFIILTIIYINAANRFEKVFLPYKLYIGLIQMNMALIVIDILSWVFNGKTGGMYPFLNTGFNFLLFFIEPLAAILWVLYADFQIFHDDRRIKKIFFPLSLLFVINAVLSISSLATGWFFRVDPRNIYLRGTYYWIHIAICYGLLFYSLLHILVNRKLIEKRYYYVLLLFALPQILGGLSQVFFYGISLSWTGMMLSLLIVYFYVQNRDLNTDYLTGVYNRRQLDLIIREKIRNCAADKSFAVILIDLNDFKHINDTYGHAAGDAALQDAVKVIRGCLRNDDLIARYGGDEFYIILDLNDKRLLEAAVNRIQRGVELFNRNYNKPYKLSFCMGYDVYNYHTGSKADDFLKHIDRLMYQNKNAAKFAKK